MGHMATTCTAESLPVARCTVYVPTGGARLRAVGGRHLEQLAAAPPELVVEQADELAPASIQDAARQSAVRAHHVVDLQILDDDRPVALGVGVAENVQDMVALASHPSVHTHDAKLGLLSVFRSPLPPCSGPLRAPQSDERGFKIPWILDDAAIRVGHQVDDSAVERDDRFGAPSWLNDLELADHGRKPLVAIAAHGARLRFAGWRPVDDDAHRPELGEAQGVAVEAPHLRMRLGEPDDVQVLAFPAWSPSETLEASLPTLVEFDEQFCAHVTRDVGEPRQFAAQRREVLHLVEGRRVTTLSAGSSETHDPLLVGEVPEKPKSMLPTGQPLNLGGSRVDAVAVSLAEQHTTIIAPLDLQLLRSGQSTRRGMLPALEDRGCAPKSR